MESIRVRMVQALAREIRLQRSFRSKIFVFDEIFSESEEGSKLALDLYPIMTELFGAGLDMGIEVFDFDNLLEIDKPELSTFNELVRRRSSKIADDISDVTARRIRKAATANRTSPQKIAQEILDSGVLGKVRAMRIARTESINLLNRGQETAWQASGVVAEKEWYTALDERVCQWCGPLHGATQSLGDNYFTEGEDYVGNKGGTLKIYENSPTPTIHPSCRCTLLPIVK